MIKKLYISLILVISVFMLYACDNTSSDVVITYQNTTLENGKVGQAYSTNIATATGADNITYAIKSGVSLPGGLSLIGTAIYGTPTEDGVFSFIIVASSDDAVAPVEATFSLTIDAADPVLANIIFSGSVLENGEVGTAYNVTLTASGVENIVFSSTNIPSGLALSSDGIISGTPTSSGTFYFSVTVSAEGANSNTKDFAITINAESDPVLDNITFIGITLDSAVAGMAYSTSVSASGADDITFSSSDMPNGLTLNSDGTITGTPTTVGSFLFTIIASAEGANSNQAAFSIIVESGSPYIYEAEYTDFTGISGSGWSNTQVEWGMVLGDGETTATSNGMYVAYFTPPYATLTFSFNSTEAGTGRLIFSMGSEYVKEFDGISAIILDPSIMTLTVNGVSMDYLVPVIGLNEPNILFNEYIFLEQFNIIEGENIIQITMLPNDYFPARTGGGPNVDYMKIETDLGLILNLYCDTVDEVKELRGY